MTCWRDVLFTLGEVRRRLSPLNLRVVGVDGVYPRLKGKSRGVVIGVGMGDGIPIAIMEADEKDPKALSSKLRPLVDQLGVEVVVTDDLGGYRTMAEELGLEHQVCRFHLLRWARKEINRLKRSLGKEWRWIIEEVEGILSGMPPDGGRRLFERWLELQKRGCRSGPLKVLKDLLSRLSEGWGRYCLYRKREGVPSTHNRTEQAIGRFRIRAKAMRGVSSWAGLEAAFVLPHLKVA